MSSSSLICQFYYYFEFKLFHPSPLDIHKECPLRYCKLNFKLVIKCYPILIILFILHSLLGLNFSSSPKLFFFSWVHLASHLHNSSFSNSLTQYSSIQTSATILYPKNQIIKETTRWNMEVEVAEFIRLDEIRF